MLHFILIALTAVALAKKNKGGGGGSNSNKNKGSSNINSCEAQEQCMTVDSITSVTSYGKERYEVCIMFKHDLKDCRKGAADTLASICYGDSIGDHKGNCKS